MPKIKNIERTPNPNSIRFIIDLPLTQGITYSFESKEEAQQDELARGLFSIKHVINVYYVDRFITVTQDGNIPWSILLRDIAPFIRNAKSQSTTNQYKSKQEQENRVIPGSDDPRFEKIMALLNEQVRPYLMADGGGLEVHGFEKNILTIHYQGACGSCPAAISGTLYAIEGMLKRIDPKIQVTLS